MFDEAHTFTGISGAETACLIRRLRRFCGRNASQTTCVATSATIVDKNYPDAARNFASRFFGVSAESVVMVNEEYQRDEWRTCGAGRVARRRGPPSEERAPHGPTSGDVSGAVRCRPRTAPPTGGFSVQTERHH